MRTKCLFTELCKKQGVVVDICPFKDDAMLKNLNILQVNCSTWNDLHDKEVKKGGTNAQKEGLGDAVAGSRGQT